MVQSTGAGRRPQVKRLPQTLPQTPISRRGGVRQEYGSSDWDQVGGIGQRVFPGNGDRQIKLKMSSLIQPFEGPFPHCPE